MHDSDQNGIVTIVQLQPISVVFTAPEENVPVINKALEEETAVPVEALSSDGLRTLSQGRLARVNNEVDQASGTIRMKAIFENKDNVLWPGLSVSTRLLVETLKDAIVIPDDAVQRGPNGLYAFVVGDDNKVGVQDIKVSQSGDGEFGRRAGPDARPAGRGGRTVSTPGRLGGAADRGAAVERAGERGRQFPAQGARAMNAGLSSWFIRHPIATSLLMVGVLFVGIVVYPKLPVAPLPQVDFPTIQVSANLPGASPDTMASAVAQPLETQFAQIPGVAQMTSTSALGTTAITLQFDLDRNIDAAANDVQAAINASSGQLPKNLPTPPTYRKVNPADSPDPAAGRDLRYAAADHGR